MGNLAWAIPAPLEKGARSGRFADHPTVFITPVHSLWSPSTGTGGRHQSELVVAINRKPRSPWPGARRLKALEDENGKLKKLLAESMMDVSTLREMLAKNF